MLARAETVAVGEGGEKKISELHGTIYAVIRYLAGGGGTCTTRQVRLGPRRRNEVTPGLPGTDFLQPLRSEFYTRSTARMISRVGAGGAGRLDFTSSPASPPRDRATSPKDAGGK